MKAATLLTFLLSGALLHAQGVTSHVNPFIGTANYGACNPGAVTPNGMMSVSPFNVMGSSLTRTAAGGAPLTPPRTAISQASRM